MAMTREEHLLVILAEECNEVAHRVAKALRFGMAEVQEGQALTNAQRIAEELCHLTTVADMLGGEYSENGFAGIGHFDMAIRIKKRLAVENWMAHSISQGTIQE